MKNECSECGANLADNQIECFYCGAARQNADEVLLVELMNVKRKYEEAYARGSKLIVESLLADNYELVEIDAGSEMRVDRQTTLENTVEDKNFLSFSISREELLERTLETAKMACVQTINRRVFDGVEPYFTKAQISFVWREGRWQIAAERLITIDENGREFE